MNAVLRVGIGAAVLGLVVGAALAWLYDKCFPLDAEAWDLP